MLLVGISAEFRSSEGLSEDQMGFYRRFFARGGEIGGAGKIVRFVRYEGAVEDGRESVFLGVDLTEDAGGRELVIPEGMVAWSLDAGRWRVIQGPEPARAGASPAVQPIEWVWRACRDDRWFGDFRTSAGENSSSTDFRQATYRMTANAYRDFGAGYAGGDTVDIVPYDPSWPARYAEFAVALATELGPEIALRVEHIGSTAVPGLPAKPIIDVLVEIPPGPLAAREIIPSLDGPTWEYWWYGDHMMYIKRDKPMGRRTHHVHFGSAGSGLWERVAFRDYLRSHAGEAAAYARLKLELASRHEQDREAYTQAKGDFVRAVTDRARAWRGDRAWQGDR